MKHRFFALVAISWPLVCALAHAQAGEASVKTDTSETEKVSCVSAASQAQTDRDAGRLLEGRRQLVACARDACPAIVRRSCAEWLAELETRIPSIVLRVRDSASRDVTEARASLDGVPVALDGRPIALDPGPHEITVTAPNANAVAHKILVVEAETGRLISLRLTEPGATHELPAAQHAVAVRETGGFEVPVGAWVLGAAGVVSLAAFTYFAVSAADEHAALETRCAPSCSRAQTSAGRNDALAADIALGIGLGALAAATTWALLAGWDTPEPALRTAVIPARDGIFGSVSTRF